MAVAPETPPPASTTYEPGAGSESDPSKYTPSGELITAATATTEVASPPPDGIMPASPSDGPFSTTVVPSGWARLPTEAEVAWLNAEYGYGTPV